MAKKQSKKSSSGSHRTIILLCFILFLIIFSGSGIVCIHSEYEQFMKTPLNLGGSERIVQVSPGSSAKSIVSQLCKDEIVSSEWMMRYVFRQSGLENKLQPGTVILTPDMTPADLPNAFAKIGKYARKSVQILTGMNLYDIAEKLHSQKIADKTLFLSLAFDPAYCAESGIPSKSFEGYVSAGAYTFDAGTKTEDILAEMHERWVKQWQKIVDDNRGAYESSLRRLGNDHAIVTLASIVEKEAMLDAERPIIARVFYNRIHRQMMLQSDPTCVYPPLVPNEKPSPARCRDKDNAYSTYVQKGLPPGPIAIPSVSSLKAVLLPYDGAESSEILYFVAKQDGSKKHYFSKTYAEHQTAVEYYLKGNKSKKPDGTVVVNSY